MVSTFFLACYERKFQMAQFVDSTLMSTVGPFKLKGPRPFHAVTIIFLFVSSRFVLLCCRDITFCQHKDESSGEYFGVHSSRKAIQIRHTAAYVVDRYIFTSVE